MKWRGESGDAGGTPDGPGEPRKPSDTGKAGRPDYAPAFDMTNRDLPPWVGDFGRRYDGRDDLPELPEGYDETALDPLSRQLAHRPVLWRETRPLYVVSGDYEHTRPGARDSMLWVMIHHDDTASLHTPMVEHPLGVDIAEGQATSNVAARIFDSEVNLGLVPPTALIRAHAGAGVLQEWVHDSQAALYCPQYPEFTQAKMAVLDYAMATGYRGKNTYLTVAGDAPGEHRIAAIGNKYGAPDRNGYDLEIRSDFTDMWHGRDLPADLVKQIRRVDTIRLAERLIRSGRPGPAVAGILDRFDEMRDAGKITGDTWGGRIRSSEPMDPW